jgi:polysaccharide biosynthesis transport protein
MELRYFFFILFKRKWLLLTVVIAAAVATAFVVGMLPKKYKSSSVIETGLIDYKSVRAVGEANPFIQEFEIESKFANLVELMKGRPAINALTKKLILHDLRPIDSVATFRKLQLDEKSGISQDQIDKYLDALTLRPDSIGILEVDKEHVYVARSLEKAMGYDYETIREKIDIKRVEKSQYMRVEFVAEKPELAYFVTKNFIDEFMNSFYMRKDTFENKAYKFYQHLVQEKKSVLDNLNNEQVNYARNNGLVAPLEQAQAIVAQIKEMEMARDDEQKKKVGYQKTLDVYAAQFKGYKDNLVGSYAESMNTNNDIRNLDKEIEKLNNKWVESGAKDANLQNNINELKALKVSAVEKIAKSRYDNTNPALNKQNELFLKYVEAQSDLGSTEQRVKSLNTRIEELYRKKTQLVGNNAIWTKLSKQIETADAEYKYAIDKQNQADVIQQSGEQEKPVRIIDPPIYPYKPESSKRALISAFAGVGAGTVATIFLFMLTYFDKSLSSIFQYEKQIGLPLLASLNKLNSKQWGDYDTFFSADTKSKEAEFFKESLRKIRYAIESSDAKSFLITSLKDQEGKSFLIASLAYSFTLKHKKVLIIDTNFKNNTLSTMAVKPFENNPVSSEVKVLPSTTALGFTINMPTVDIIGNKGGHNSPSELLSGVDFKKKIADLGVNYDYIFLEAAAMSKYSDALELVDFVEKVIPVFDASTSLSSKDDNSLEFLKTLKDKVLGGVLNKADLRNLN